MTPATPRRSMIALAAACLSGLMFGLEISSIPAILPTLQQVLHADFKQLQWIMNAYTIAVTTVLMATGTLADRYGRKRIFVVAIAAFGVTSLICGLTGNVSVLIAGRFLQGMSGGAMLICLIAVLSHQFREGRERAIAFGWWGIISGIGLGFGPIIGAAIVAVSSWEWVFLIHVRLLHYAGTGPRFHQPRRAGDHQRLRSEFHRLRDCGTDQPSADVRFLCIPDTQFLGCATRIDGHEFQLLAVHDLPADLFSGGARL